MDCSFRHSWSRARRIPSEPCLSLPLSLLPSLLCFLCAGFVPRQAFSKMDPLAALGLYHPDSNPRRKSFPVVPAKILELDFIYLPGCCAHSFFFFFLTALIYFFIYRFAYSGNVI